MKNQLLCRVFGNYDKDKTGFPFRGVDYDPEKRMLYAGDEMGYMLQWDVS